MIPRKNQRLKRLGIGLLSALMVLSNVTPALASEVEASNPEAVQVVTEVVEENETTQPEPSAEEVPQSEVVTEVEPVVEATEEKVEAESLPKENEVKEEVKDKEEIESPQKEESKEEKEEPKDDEPKYQIRVEGEQAIIEVAEAKKEAKAGEKIQVNVSAPAGYVIPGIELKDIEGKTLQVIQGNQLDFMMPAKDVLIYSRGERADVPTDYSLFGDSGFRRVQYLAQGIDTWVGREIHGTAVIGGSTTHPINGSWFDVSSLEEIGFMGSTSRFNQSRDGNAIWCRNAGAATPENVQASFTARCVAIEGGYAYWDLLITPPGATATNNLDRPWNGFLTGYQRIGNTRFRVPVEEHARFKLKKVSSNPTKTNGNPDYSLIGTQFWLVNSKTNLKLDRVTVKDASGYIYSSSGSADFRLPVLSNGQSYAYHLEEISAGKGYKLRTDKIPLNLNKDTELVTVTNDPVEPSLGTVEIFKRSSNPAISNAYPEKYSLAGAIYGLYKASNDQEIATLTINAEGYAKATQVPKDIYYLQEKQAPPGYHLDTRRYKVVIDDSVLKSVEKKVTVNVTEKPKDDPIVILIKKVDKTTGQPVATGKGTLAGAEFTVKYYPTLGDITGVNAQRTWVLETDKDGFTYLDNNYKKSGDDFFINSLGIPTMPFGTLTIQETKAPVGYLVDSTIHTIKIENIGQAEGVTTYNPPIVNEQPIKGDLLIRKTSDSGEKLPNVTFSITSKTTGQEVMSITTNAEGIATTKRDGATEGSLLFDDYIVKEVNVPEGYLPLEPFEVSITENMQVVEVSKVNISQKGDLLIRKTGEGGKKLPGITFSITSQTTGKEVMQITTNAEGIATTKKEGATQGSLVYGKYMVRELNPPKEYLGLEPFEISITENLQVVEVSKVNILKRGSVELLKVEEGDPSIKLAGATFELYQEDKKLGEKTTGEDGILRFDNLVLGMYRLVETKAPEGYFLPTKEKIDITFEVKEHGEVVKVTAENEKIPSMQTTAGENGQKLYYPTGKKKIPDYIKYQDLVIGATYQVKTVLMDQATGKQVLDKNGQPYVIYTDFVPTQRTGIHEIWVEVDAELLVGKEVVWFEYYYRDGRLVMAHTDLYDKGQTVKFVNPKLSSKATINGGKLAYVGETIRQEDTAIYEDFIPGTKVTFLSVTMDKDTRQSLIVDGQEVRQEMLVEVQANGEASLNFKPYASANLGAKNLVNFLYAYDEAGNLIAKHEDWEDENQSTSIIPFELKTTATVNGAKEVKLGQMITLKDTIKPGRVIEGKEVRAVAKATRDGKVIIIDGKELTAEKTFVLKADTDLDVIFEEINSKLIGEGKVTLYEYIYDLEGNLLGKEEEPNNEDQSIKIVKPIGRITIGRPPSPKTGDSSSLVWLGLMISSLVTYFAISFPNKKRDNFLKR